MRRILASTSTRICNRDGHYRIDPVAKLSLQAGTLRPRNPVMGRRNHEGTLTVYIIGIGHLARPIINQVGPSDSPAHRQPDGSPLPRTAEPPGEPDSPEHGAAEDGQAPERRSDDEQWMVERVALAIIHDVQ